MSDENTSLDANKSVFQQAHDMLSYNYHKESGIVNHILQASEISKVSKSSAPKQTHTEAVKIIQTNLIFKVGIVLLDF